MPGESNRRQLGSLSLCSRDVFPVLVNPLVAVGSPFLLAILCCLRVLAVVVVCFFVLFLRPVSKR